MVTMVGTERDFLNMLGDLMALDYDAIAAYDSAISRLEDSAARQQLQEFRDDHHRHTRKLQPPSSGWAALPLPAPEPRAC